jgi:hypothetical protein
MHFLEAQDIPILAKLSYCCPLNVKFLAAVNCNAPPIPGEQLKLSPN